MKRSVLQYALSGLAVALAFSAYARESEELGVTHVIEVPAKNSQERSAIANLGFALEEFRSDKVYIYGNKEDEAVLRQAGFDARAFEAKPEWFTTSSVGPNATKYTSYADAVAQMQQMQTQHPNIVSLSSLGRSLEGRDATMVRISGKSVAQAESERLPVVLYMGCHHAREHLSVEVPLMFAHYLVDNYGTNAEVTRLVDSREIYIAPVVNPDGHVYDYTNGIRGRMWRKNRARNNGGTMGVDLNRNYGYHWGEAGSSTNGSSEVFQGPTPFSEPETKNVRDFVNSQPRMTTLLSFHTFSELVLYPWGYSSTRVGEGGVGTVEDRETFKKMAETMAQWNHYTPEQSSDLYAAAGDMTDWAYGAHGIFAFTFEMDPTNQWDGGFYPSPSVIQPVFDKNLKPMMYMLEYANNPKRVLTERAPSFLRTPAKAGVAVASFQDIL